MNTVGTFYKHIIMRTREDLGPFTDGNQTGPFLNLCLGLWGLCTGNKQRLSYAVEATLVNTYSVLPICLPRDVNMNNQHCYCTFLSCKNWAI